MGKYMKTGKITGDVAVMEVPQSALGVRTRAKTLALQRSPEACYLQLRSRRLEKPQFPPPSLRRKPEKQEKNKLGSKQSNRSRSHQSQSRRSASRLRVESVNSGPAGSASFTRSKKGDTRIEERDEGCFGQYGSGSTAPMDSGKGGGIQKEKVDELGVEVSFGDNNLEFNATARSTRESTPCSLIRDFESVGTPGSGVRSTCTGAVNQRGVQDPVQRSIPSMLEMEDFFAPVERQQQKQFMDKYNFDVMNDLPLPGRYEWVRVDP